VNTLLFRALDALYDGLVMPSYGAAGYRLRQRRWDAAAIPDDLGGRSYVVTGANAGLGYALTQGLLRRGATVVMVCRDRAKGEAAVNALRKGDMNGREGRALLVVADLSLMADAARAGAEALALAPTLDGLVNNAGVMIEAREVTTEGIEKSFATNVLSGFLLTRALWPALAAASARGGQGRVVHVTSGGMYTQRLDVADLQWERKRYDGVAAYAQTKRAQVVLSALWAVALAPDGVTSNAMHPGWAATPGVRRSLPRFERLMGGWLRDAEQGADTALWLATSAQAQGISGKLLFDREVRREHILPFTREAAGDAQALWARCEALIAACLEGGRMDEGRMDEGRSADSGHDAAEDRVTGARP
jgi:dehydrogenase/reductase SDR family protein 12